MPNVYRAAPAIAEFESAKPPPVTVSASRPTRWEVVISFVAAAAVFVVIGALLATLITELRGGWVVDHEQRMDKATAVHKLLFRH
jgi:hypothetical protein